LLGTVYQESQGDTRRQHGVNVLGNTGGFGIVQIEWPTVRECLGRLDANPVLALRLARWVFEDDRYGHDWYRMGFLYRKTPILWMLRTSDRLALALARVNYGRFVEPIPGGTQLQAAYYKKYWNTKAGKGTPDQYLRNWLAHCQRTVEDWELAHAE